MSKKSGNSRAIAAPSGLQKPQEPEWFSMAPFRPRTVEQLRARGLEIRQRQHIGEGAGPNAFFIVDAKLDLQIGTVDEKGIQCECGYKSMNELCPKCKRWLGQA